MADIEARKPLSKFEFAQLILEQQGLCGCGCGEKIILAPRMTRDEHLHQLATGGSNDLKNRSIWRPECVDVKNRSDAHARKKGRSLLKTTKKSQRPKKKIQSRGFDKTKTKGFDGKVRARK